MTTPPSPQPTPSGAHGDAGLGATTVVHPRRWALPIHPPYGSVKRPVLRTKSGTRLTIDPKQVDVDQPLPGADEVTQRSVTKWIVVATIAIILTLLSALVLFLLFYTPDTDTALSDLSTPNPPATFAPSEPIDNQDSEGNRSGADGSSSGSGADGEGGAGQGGQGSQEGQNNQGGQGGDGAAGGGGDGSQSDQASQADGGSQGGIAQDGSQAGSGGGGAGQGGGVQGKGPNPGGAQGGQQGGQQGGSSGQDQGAGSQGGSSGSQGGSSGGSAGSSGGGESAPSRPGSQGQAAPTPRRPDQLEEPPVSALTPFMQLTLVPLDAHDQGPTMHTPQEGMVEQRNDIRLSDGRIITVTAFRGTGTHQRINEIIGDKPLDIPLAYGEAGTQDQNPRLFARMGADGQIVGVIMTSDTAVRVSDLEALVDGIRFNFD